jgi:hypothetical protein
VAHLPAYVFFIIESKQDGHQSNARIASSRFLSGHAGHIYASSDSSEATSAEQRQSTSAGRRQLLIESFCMDVPIVCAYFTSLVYAKTLAIQ